MAVAGHGLPIVGGEAPDLAIAGIGGPLGAASELWHGLVSARPLLLETLALAGTRGVDIVSALIGAPEDLELVDRTADIILLSREALAAGLDRSFSRPERIRPWTYDFDPSGLELVRRAIEHVASARPIEAVSA